MPGLSILSEWKSNQYFARKAPRLFLTVFFGVGLCCFFRVMPTMNRVRPSRVSMVRRFLMVPRLVMLGRFKVVPSGVSMMF